jgi:hypothetical protein
MKSEREDALRQATERTERAAPGEVRAIRESVRMAREANEVVLLAELRMQRERIKRLIRLLSEESRTDGGTVVASGPSRASRYGCHARHSRAD